MGCFLACFKGDKDRKRRRPRNRRVPSDQIQESYKFLQENPPPKQLEPEVEVAPDVLGPELREKPEQESFTGSRKKVTFDLNVTTYEEAPAHQEAKNSAEEGEEKEGNTDEKEPHDDEGKAVPSLGAFPLNHRYQNCEGSDDEDAIDGEEEEEEEYEDCDFDEDENEIGIEGNEEESYESFFSLPLEKERKSFREVNSPIPVKAASPDKEPIILAKGSARDRSQYIHSVLNPVENLSQWKEVKEHATAPKNSMKENVGLELETKGSFSSEPEFKIRKPPNASVSNASPIYTARLEIPVDASLSNWLVSSPMEGPQASNSVQSNSSLSREEQPILGALTVEDLKQSSVTSSPRRSPSRSPDDIPIVGTVGSYWSSQKKGDDSSSSSSQKSSSETAGIPNTTSKYGEDKTVNWHSTPFEVRLERALNQSAAIEGCSMFP